MINKICVELLKQVINNSYKNISLDRIDYNDAAHNKKVYGSILKHYELNNPNKQEKRKLMKLK